MSDIQEMIRQHRELLDLCQKLDEAVKCRLPRPEIYRIMDEILDCTQRHFASEKQLMAEAGYPEIETHGAKHKDLVERTGKFRKRLDLYGEENFSEWFHHWPLAEILAHIHLADRQLDEYLAQTETRKAPGPR